MEDDKQQADDRFSDVKRIRNYKVLQIARRQAVRVTFAVESMKNPGNQFMIVGLDIANTTDLEKNVFLNEIRLFASIKHPFILHYYESFVDKKLGLICVVLEHFDCINFNEVMFRLVYARIHISVKNLWKTIFYSSLIIQELEKYSIGFVEMNPKNFLQLLDGEVRLGAFHGVIHPFIDLKTDKLVSENLVPPEIAKYRTLHYKTHIWEIGYFLYLLGGLKFAFQRLPDEKVEKTALNFHKVLPRSKFERTYPEEITSLVTAMLMKHPDARPNWDEILGYEPVKLIYAEMIKLYPDLVEIAKDKTKRKLKPLVLFKSDLDSLEEQMVKNFGADTSQVPIIWKVNESQMHDDTFTDGIPAKDGKDGGEEGEEEEEDSPPPPKKK